MRAPPTRRDLKCDSATHCLIGRLRQLLQIRVLWSLIWTLIDPVSCVSCVSWMYSVNAAETHETFHQESGMRYQLVILGPIRTQLGPLRLPPRGVWTLIWTHI